MQLSQYVELAKRTESVPENIKINRDNVAFLFSIFINSAKLLDGLKRSIYYKNDERFDSKFNAHLYDICYAIDQLQDQLLDGDTPASIFKSEDVTENIDVRMFHGLLGCTSESGELMDAFMTPVMDPEGELDVVNVDEELGDHNWYEAIMTDAGKLDWDARQERNIAKLKARYPDKYTDQNALNRDLTVERTILEGGTTVTAETPFTVTYHDRHGNVVSPEQFKKLCNP